MGLQVGDAVDDVDARFFQPVRPLNVVALVEAGLELDQHGNLLPLVRGLDEQIDERRVRADPVQRHLDPGDVGIACRLREKSLDRGERVERMVNEPVLFADLVEHVGLPVWTASTGLSA